MWRIINALYEEYCQARLDEMLKLDAVKRNRLTATSVAPVCRGIRNGA